MRHESPGPTEAGPGLLRPTHRGRTGRVGLRRTPPGRGHRAERWAGRRALSVWARASGVGRRAGPEVTEVRTAAGAGGETHRGTSGCPGGKSDTRRTAPGPEPDSQSRSRAAGAGRTVRAGAGRQVPGGRSRVRAGRSGRSSPGRRVRAVGRLPEARVDPSGRQSEAEGAGRFGQQPEAEGTGEGWASAYCAASAFFFDVSWEKPLPRIRSMSLPLRPSFLVFTP
jgi:hypothetical protein